MMPQKIACFFAVLLLTACGFHLRGQVPLPESLKYVYVEGASPILREQLRKTLRASSAKLLDSPDKAQVMVKIVSENNGQGSLSLGVTGRTNEYELTYSISYQLANAKDGELKPQPPLLVKRQYYNNQQDILAKSNEQLLIVSEMNQLAAQMLLNRLIAWAEHNPK